VHPCQILMSAAACDRLTCPPYEPHLLRTSPQQNTMPPRHSMQHRHFRRWRGRHGQRNEEAPSRRWPLTIGSVCQPWRCYQPAWQRGAGRPICAIAARAVAAPRRRDGSRQSAADCAHCRGVIERRGPRQEEWPQPAASRPSQGSRAHPPRRDCWIESWRLGPSPITSSSDGLVCQELLNWPFPAVEFKLPPLSWLFHNRLENPDVVFE
jgi:hypothetical protein